MPPNPLRVAHRDALRLAKWIAWATGKYLGSQQHPRGQVMNIYRKARRDMSGVLKAKRRTMRGEAQEVLQDTRRKLEIVTNEVVLEAVAHGRESALVQLAAYADDGVQFTPQMLPAIVDDIAQAPLMEFNKQATLILGLIASGRNVINEVIGTDRVGIMQPSPVITAAADSMTKSISVAFVNTVGPEPAQDFGWKKQAISAIDDRTTDCCLTVAGQVVDFDDDFHLTASPHFNEYMYWVPFHWYCRTSVVAHLPQYDDGVTAELRDDVAKEREKRAVIEAEKEIKKGD